jgi:DNA-binding NarL/FixJ family response regulator
MVQMTEQHNSYSVEQEHTEPSETIRVMIVDTHTLMREALQRVIAAFPHMQVCASLGTLQGARLEAQKTKAQVVILSNSISVSHCLNFAQLVHENYALTGIVVIQRCPTPETTLTFIKQGVHGLLGEDASEKDLAKAIIAAASGNTFMSRRVRKVLDISVTSVPIHLTRREVDVLSLLKHGESNYQIALALGMKEKTVEKHLTHIYSKLNISSRLEAILQVHRLHI